MKVSLWAEIRRLHEIEQVNDRAIADKLGCSRYTVRLALNTLEPPIKNQTS